MKRLAPYLIAAVLAFLWLQSHDARVRAEARSEIQHDSLTREIDSLTSRDREREARRAEIQKASAARADSLRELRAELAVLDTARGDLGAVVNRQLTNDTTSADSLRASLRLAMRLWDRSTAVCTASLNQCDSLLAGRDAVIAQLDSSRVEWHAALHRTTDLWRAAERRARPGLFRRLEIALPFAAAAFLVGAILR